VPPVRCQRRAQRSARGPAEQGTRAARKSCQLRSRRCRAEHSAASATPHPVPGWDLETLLDHLSDSIGVLRQAINDADVSASAASPGCPWPRRAPARPGSQAARRLRRCRASRAAGRRREPRAERGHGRGDRSHRDHRPWLGHFGRLRHPTASPAGPGGHLGADRPAAHHPGNPAWPVRRPGSAARPSLRRRPARRLPRPPTAPFRRVRVRRRLNRARRAGRAAAIPANPAGLYQ
jgi:hypothetical protein